MMIIPFGHEESWQERQARIRIQKEKDRLAKHRQTCEKNRAKKKKGKSNNR